MNAYLMVAHSMWHQNYDSSKPPCPGCGVAMGQWVQHYQCFNLDCEVSMIPIAQLEVPGCPVCHSGEPGLTAYLKTLTRAKTLILTPQQAAREAEGFATPEEPIYQGPVEGP